MIKPKSKHVAQCCSVTTKEIESIDTCAWIPKGVTRDDFGIGSLMVWAHIKRTLMDPKP